MNFEVSIFHSQVILKQVKESIFQLLFLRSWVKFYESGTGKFYFRISPDLAYNSKFLRKIAR